MPSFMKNLHLLIIGINEFKYQRNLRGCVNDAKNMKAYLEKTFSHTFHIYTHTLFNEKATKVQIVASFQEHLIAQAREGDMAVFYFSGHGAQEEASEVFLPYEWDKLLEGLVCHNSSRKGETLLADKEIRYLFHQLAQKGCKLLAIFDCCHAGDSARDLLEEKTETDVQEKFIERRLGTEFPKRKWSQFIFSKDPQFVDDTIFKEKHIDEIWPPANYIQLAACLPFESAYEHPRKHYGFFTHNLLNVLEEYKGNISYFELDRLVRHKLHIKNCKQTPRLYAPKPFHEELFNAFLGGLLPDPLEQLYYSEGLARAQMLKTYLTYHQLKKKWILNIGGIHGLVKQRNGIPQSVLLCKESESYALMLKNIYPNYSEVEVPKILENRLNKETNYEVILNSLLTSPVSIYLIGVQDKVSIVKQYVENNQEELNQDQIHIVDDVYTATYQLHINQGYYSIHRSFDSPPLIKEISADDFSALDEVFKKFRHISQWNFTKKLTNPNHALLNNHPINLSMQTSDGENILYHPSQQFIALPHHNPYSAKAPTFYSFTFTNNSQRALYIACFYLNQLFEVDINYLIPNVVKLDPGMSIKALNDGRVSLLLPDYIRDFNIKEEICFLKIIASTSPFDVNAFALPPLDAPTRRSEDNYELIKGFKIYKTPQQEADWLTQLIEFRFVNPLWA